MDFTFDEEQEALRDAVRGLLKGYDPTVDAEHRRQVTAEDPGFDEDLWKRLAEMGLLGLPFAEADGGMGAGPVEVAVVCEEIGRVSVDQGGLGGPPGESLDGQGARAAEEIENADARDVPEDREDRFAHPLRGRP
jgi:alkylation response protein AidB-like acyl-CoA dehydrogenase